jgi:lipopolysaccharide transport system permease protein
MEEKYHKWTWTLWLLHLNPMTYFVRAYRFMLLGSAGRPLHDIAAATGFAVMTFVVGGLFFRQMKKGFADVL